VSAARRRPCTSSTSRRTGSTCAVSRPTARPCVARRARSSPDAATPARDSTSAVRAAVAQRPPRAGGGTSFAVGPVRERGYGVGPRRYSILPTGGYTPTAPPPGCSSPRSTRPGRLDVSSRPVDGEPRTWPRWSAPGGVAGPCR
jgi:hypothetical protein